MVMSARVMLGGAAALALASAAALASPAADPLALEQQRLVTAKQQAEAATARAARLDAAAAAEQDAAGKARAEEQAVAARIDKAEADIAAAETRIALVQERLDEARSALAEQQGPVVRLIAALAAFARRPAVAAVAQPGSIDDLVHVRAVLGTVAPAVTARTAGLRDKLAETRALRANAALAAKSLTDSRAALDAEQLKLARLEMTHRQRSVVLSRESLAQSDRAIAMGETARDAIDRMDAIGDAVAVAAALEKLPDPAPRPDSASVPGISAWSGDAPYRLPVAGRLVTGFGEVSNAGVRSRGLTLDAAPGATVVAPAAGRVAYARAFGDYGMVIILDHGDGWTTLITGLGAAAVARGAHVAQGAAIGTATGDGRLTVELRRRGRPIDMVPLLG
ncbi:MAG TPA: peptidoglycan DD-metalloendopeptidase family protein [Sphingomonas sp.]|nr:peptidoglycan DD-metalloendopeptidase family protein [Sphingomonas sp.]